MRDVSILFKALANETRLFMLALLLKHGELCVCDLVEVLGITQSKASRHLRYLWSAGLLEDRREAVWIHYRISESLPDHPRAIVEAVPGIVDRKKLASLERDLAKWLKNKAKSTCVTPVQSRRNILATREAE